MKVKVDFCIDADIIECPTMTMLELNDYQQAFFKWLFDEENDHKYWMYNKGVKEGCNYRADALVEWFNTFIFTDPKDKVVLLETCSKESNDDLLTLHF